MQRKKNSQDEDPVGAAANLDDDEEIVISDVRTIKKGKRPSVEPEAVEIEPEIFDVEPEDENPFPPGSVGYRAYQGDDPPELTECNILVIRKPDSAGDKFVVPCSSRLSLSPIRNVELSTQESEIEEIVRLKYGGGHYYLQIQFGNTLGRGWSPSLADSPENIAKAKAEASLVNQPASIAEATPQTPPRDPMNEFLENLEKQKRMRDLLFGDELKELAELRQKAAQPPKADEPQSETLTILEKALSSNNTSIQERLLDYAFPTKEDSHWIPELAKTLFEHKAEIAGLLQVVLGGMSAPTPAMPQPSIEQILRSAPPPTPQPPNAGFKRKAIKSETNDNDNTGLEASEKSNE